MMRYLHVCDKANAVPKGQPGCDKIYKIRPFLDLLLPKFVPEYNLHEHISVDEAMVPSRGRLGFQQFITNKPVRFGIKIWELADSHTGYVWKQQLYTGANAEDGKPEKGLAKNVVKQLCSGLEESYHQLFTDNFYTGVELYKELHDSGIYACGTILATRKHFPKEIVFGSTRNIDRGTCQWRYAFPLLAVAWLDNKPVYFLSTIYKPHRLLEK